jgi:hypothetical protein
LSVVDGEFGSAAWGWAGLLVAATPAKQIVANIIVKTCKILIFMASSL